MPFFLAQDRGVGSIGGGGTSSWGVDDEMETEIQQEQGQQIKPAKNDVKEKTKSPKIQPKSSHVMSLPKPVTDNTGRFRSRTMSLPKPVTDHTGRFRSRTMSLPKPVTDNTGRFRSHVIT